MEIWRLEHKDKGYGPYASNAIISQIALPTVECAKEDCSGFPIGWVCGCPSKEILEWMFGPVLQSLILRGFVIRKFEIPDGDFIIGKSGKQVIFRKPIKTQNVYQRLLEHYLSNRAISNDYLIGYNEG